MAKLWVKTLNITSNPSGAAQAARQGNVVMIVDVIDMSTTAETVLEAGALVVYGASPSDAVIPVTVNPEKIGYIAGKKAVKNDTGIIIAAEPRLCADENILIENAKQVIRGIKRTGGNLEKIIPNAGKDVVKLANFMGKIVIVVSKAGGAAYDAAYNYGAPEVITGTIARTADMDGEKAVLTAAERAIELAKKYKCGITIVAASSNAVEDVLAAYYIGQTILEKDFLQIKSGLD